MSDFLSAGWSVYIAVATIASLVGCLLLLFFASRARTNPKDDTGHVWDGDLRELNNPMPRWWMVLFVVTVIFGFAYLALYPGLGSSQGLLGWSSARQYREEQAQADARLAGVYAKYASTPAPELARDKGAMAIGERLFMNNCSGCHGSDARGGRGFPNLTDADWLYGGSPETIVETITHGRQGMMPPMAAALGDDRAVQDVADYVLSLSGAPHDAAAAGRGQAHFIVCAGCHGADGKGNPAIGAPNLTDDIWLHGSGHAAVVRMIQNGKTNVMPAQERRLTPAQIHVVGAYVWSLSHAGGAR
ncbi:MAG TPA: cytochrome-c oxidase, cbb3-type subunit III [Burkholderiaceae bacterium]